MVRPGSGGRANRTVVGRGKSHLRHDFGASCVRLKAPGNRPTLPHVAPEGAETRFASTTAHFGMIQWHFQSFSKGSSSRSRIVFQPRSSAAQTRCFTTCGFAACYGSVKKM